MGLSKRDQGGQADALAAARPARQISQAVRSPLPPVVVIRITSPPCDSGPPGYTAWPPPPTPRRGRPQGYSANPIVARNILNKDNNPDSCQP
jgi:hypothetical protein